MTCRWLCRAQATRVPVSNALHTIFVTAAIVAALGLLVVLYLRERPLRKDT
jgi:ABC-type transport system involved in cytochrome c biogenesis permease subunit